MINCLFSSITRASFADDPERVEAEPERKLEAEAPAEDDQLPLLEYHQGFRDKGNHCDAQSDREDEYVGDDE
jgi:hypothetical protein